MQKNLLIFLCYFLKRVLLNLNTDTYVCNEAQFLATIHRSDRLTIDLRPWCSVRTHTRMCRQCYAWCSLFRQCSFPEWWDRGMELPNKDSKFLKRGKEDRGNVVRTNEYIRQFWQKKIWVHWVGIKTTRRAFQHPNTQETKIKVIPHNCIAHPFCTYFMASYSAPSCRPRARAH